MIKKEINDHNLYRCHSCEVTFSGEPMSGHYFEVSSLGALFDEDRDFFIEGSRKIVVGVATRACHNDDYPCKIDDGDWVDVICWMLVCDCGEKYTFDNDYCTVHGYSSEADAMHAAKSCSCQKTKAENAMVDGKKLPMPKPSVGDLLVVDVDRAQGAIWSKGQVIKVTNVGGEVTPEEGYILAAIAEPDNGSGTWNIYTGSCSPYDDGGLSDKFRPKTAEKKKVVHIEF